MTLAAPEPLAEHHRLDDFHSGVASLDEWLRRRAWANQASGATRTYVICEGERVAGYYALASGAVDVAHATGRFRRNMPEPVPVAVLARLALGRDYQGRGLGRALFRDCASRISVAADIIGIRGVVVDAISDGAKAFYLAIGFDASPFDPMLLMITLTDMRKGFAP
ncbi:MAG TPA: GNAT family N-acetyltransferase [Rhizomicrobium sp.]|jgi:ribosomal protein S18 acetylase RimI-like enzyme|nr:GNAT family N-acetyltransferase [Rhizomicrobium sp.]